MSEADKMFEELGYKKYDNHPEEEKKAYYNKIMLQDTMSVEEAENIIDDMYQDKYKVIEEKNTIYLDRPNCVKFTNLEFASVIMLREIQSLIRRLEKQQKEIEKSITIKVELDDVKEYADKLIREVKENYIPKEVIRERIEELKKYIYTGKNAPQDFLQYRVKAQIRILKELLGE